MARRLFPDMTLSRAYSALLGDQCLEVKHASMAA